MHVVSFLSESPTRAFQKKLNVNELTVNCKRYHTTSLVNLYDSIHFKMSAVYYIVLLNYFDTNDYKSEIHLNSILIAAY